MRYFGRVHDDQNSLRISLGLQRHNRLAHDVSIPLRDRHVNEDQKRKSNRCSRAHHQNGDTLWNWEHISTHSSPRYTIYSSDECGWYGGRIKFFPDNIGKFKRLWFASIPGTENNYDIIQRHKILLIYSKKIYNYTNKICSEIKLYTQMRKVHSFIFILTLSFDMLIQIQTKQTKCKQTQMIIINSHIHWSKLFIRVYLHSFALNPD